MDHDHTRLLCPACQANEGETERLRAALKQIADMPPPMDFAGKVYDAEQKIAKAALGNCEQKVTEKP